MRLILVSMTPLVLLWHRYIRLIGKVGDQKRRSPLLAAAILFFFASSGWAITLYKWTDEKGVVHVSEKKPEGVEAEKKTYGDRQTEPRQQIFDIGGGEPGQDVQAGKGSGREYNLLKGTGFFINDSGNILTNYHLVNGCSRIVGKLEERAIPLSVIRVDAANDLALLKAEGNNFPYIPLRQGQEIRAGESIVVLGFPLHGLLASEVSVATGIVSALAGIGDDRRYLQIAAPVQPGNSGGPLLDQSGNLVGVVFGKLDALKIAKVIGDIPQNINFAIKSKVVETFLDDCRVSYQKNPSDKSLAMSTVVEKTKNATVLLECYR